MKSILVSTAMAMFVSVPLFADVTNEDIMRELKQVSRKVDRLLDRDEGQNAGGVFRAGVNMACLKSSIEAYTGYKHESTLVEMADSCRDTVDEAHCKKVGQSVSNSCYEKLIDSYTGYKHQSTLKAFRDACVETVYQCR